LRTEGLELHDARFFPDGRRVVVLATEKNHTPRLFVRDLSDNGAAKPIAPEGSKALAISPDGRLVAGRARARRRSSGSSLICVRAIMM